jgi:hypothetical protein
VEGTAQKRIYVFICKGKEVGAESSFAKTHATVMLLAGLPISSSFELSIVTENGKLIL